MEVVIGDGRTRRFGPGDAVLFEDLTGQGHTSRSVGGPPDRYRAASGLAVGCAWRRKAASLFAARSRLCITLARGRQ